MLPDRYPLEGDLDTYVDAEHSLGHLLDVGIIVPRLDQLYDWSASELALPSLNALVSGEGPTPAYAWDPQDAGVWHPAVDPRGERACYLVSVIVSVISAAAPAYSEVRMYAAPDGMLPASLAADVAYDASCTQSAS